MLSNIQDIEYFRVRHNHALKKQYSEVRMV